MNTTHRLALESLCRVSRLHMTVITIVLKNDFDLPNETRSTVP